SADEDDAAGSGPLEGLEMLTPPEDVEVLDGFVAEEAPELSELLAGDADAAPSLLGEPEVAGELEPVGEMETLEEFAVTEEFADAATDGDEFFVADEEPGALAYAAADGIAEEEALPELVREFVPPPGGHGMATVDELEGQVLEDPENPELHRRLGEALLLQGET